MEGTREWGEGDKKRTKKTKERDDWNSCSMMLKLQYAHKLQKAGTHHTDLVHLMITNLRPKQSQRQAHKAGKCRSFEKRIDARAGIEKDTLNVSA